MIGVVLQPRIGHPIDLGMRLQPLGERQRVAAMPLHPQRQRFHAGQREDGVIGASAGPRSRSPSVRAARMTASGERKSGVEGKRVSVRVELGGQRISKTKQAETLY